MVKFEVSCPFFGKKQNKMSGRQVLQRSNQSNIDEIDKGLSNKWRWDWIEKTVSIDVKKAHPHITRNKTEPLMITLKDCIRKIKEPGKAICIICSKSDCIRYAAKGLGALKQHVKGKVTCKRWLGTCSVSSSPVLHLKAALATIMVHHIYHGTPVLKSNPPPQPMVHLSDRGYGYSIYSRKVIVFFYGRTGNRVGKGTCKRFTGSCQVTYVSNHIILQDGVRDRQDSERQ